MLPIPKTIRMMLWCAAPLPRRVSLSTSCIAGPSPTWAGNTVRARMEWVSQRGPSPRSRGTRLPLLVFQQRHGTVPACAGNTRRTCRTPWRSGDHPRMRGEHIEPPAWAIARLGPSPHARGTHSLAPQLRAQTGTIPACAGNTCILPSSAGRLRDHPRVRGEHHMNVPQMLPAGGPSPRARGTPRECRLVVAPDGTIPACAGNTEAAMTTPRRYQGPSPRARGTPCRGIPRRVRRGTIPACAGNTRSTSRRRTSRRDHPRVRGEHVDRSVGDAVVQGPSPRARGTQGATCGFTSVQRGFWVLSQSPTNKT